MDTILDLLSLVPRLLGEASNYTSAIIIIIINNDTVTTTINFLYERYYMTLHRIVNKSTLYRQFNFLSFELKQMPLCRVTFQGLMEVAFVLELLSTVLFVLDHKRSSWEAAWSP